MKKAFYIIFFILLSSCKPTKGYYIDEFGDKLNYENDLMCYIIRIDKSFKGYNSKKCFKNKYNFSSQEYQKLKTIFFKINRRNKLNKSIDYFTVDEARLKNESLINTEGYGLYKFNSNYLYSFNFLKTETGVNFFKCKNESDYVKILNSSKKIDPKLKNEIKIYIHNKCSNYDYNDKLIWFSSGRFY